MILEKEEVYQLIKEYQEKCCNNALEIIIEKNKGLIFSILTQNNLKFDDEDSFQEGVIGIIKAVKRFNMKKGLEFSTYATYWIKQQILRNKQDNIRTIRIPVHLQEAYNKIVLEYDIKDDKDWEKVPKKYRNRTCNYVVKDLRNTIEKSFCISIDNDIQEKGESLFIKDLLEDKKDRYKEKENDMLRNRIIEIIKETSNKNFRDSKKYSNIFIERFGLEDRNDKTLEYLAQKYNKTREGIRHIQENFLEKLKKNKEFMEIMNDLRGDK